MESQLETRFATRPSTSTSSIAARLPYDVLVRILEELADDTGVVVSGSVARWTVTSQPDIASTALVCSQWNEPATRVLWRSVALNSAASARAFGKQARASQDLAARVMSLSIGWPNWIKAEWDLEFVRGELDEEDMEDMLRNHERCFLAGTVDMVLALQACPNVQRLHVMLMDRLKYTFLLHTILKKHQLSTVVLDDLCLWSPDHHLDTWPVKASVLPPYSICSILRLPSLRVLDITTYAGWTDHEDYFPPKAGRTAPLKRFGFQDEFYNSQIFILEIITACSSTLEVVDVAGCARRELHHPDQERSTEPDPFVARVSPFGRAVVLGSPAVLPAAGSPSHHLGRRRPLDAPPSPSVIDYPPRLLCRCRATGPERRALLASAIPAQVAPRTPRVRRRCGAVQGGPRRTAGKALGRGRQDKASVEGRDARLACALMCVRITLRATRAHVAAVLTGGVAAVASYCFNSEYVPNETHVLLIHLRSARTGP